ncbi:putative benzoate 4-monooxygenase cytochrome P450 [Talaromyces proteolyticus]|uniref:Benzoate 4-monooxygenase cytochrome P450 n=1 Tax=Talaromyces proteolyticus TaxID=1131652 RepID=A0AAD4L1V4_9EURO|nr:putative benzoate 4-monooxygenase cytochrome P450 [Talaromyces proteolyticus]KAH8705075.1 putative benzoate 4-monooxygenase cytochrome P450 [Talaromyces proteolyticus]
MAGTSSIVHAIYVIIIQLPLLTFAAGILYIATTCIYRIYFHPFAKIPGPFLAKLTDAYALYHAWIKDTHLTIYSLHNQYGTIIRYGPDKILVNDVDGMKEIYGFNANFRKGREYEAMRFNPVHSIFNATDKKMHRRKRRLVGQGFSDSALRASESSILEHIDRFVNAVLDEDGRDEKRGGWVAAKDVSVFASYLSLDLITDLVFGKSTDTLIKPDNRQFRPLLVMTGTRMTMAFQMPSAFRTGKSGQWLDLGTWMLHNVDILRAQWAGMLRGWAMDRIQAEKTCTTEPSRRDMMSTIINATDPDTGETLDPQEIGAEAFTLITAGGDTTSVGISATFFYLSRNPIAYERLVREIRSRFESVDAIRIGSTLSSCHYLRGCIDEAMRISPPIAVPLYREAGQGGATICGVFVPEGYVAASHVYAMHHNEKYYPDPYSYRPERWLPPTPAYENESISVTQEAKSAFLAFSHGPRNCIAVNLAYLNLSLSVARLVWMADFRVPHYPSLVRIGEGDPNDKNPLRRRVNEYQLYDIFASDKKGPMLEFRRRDGGR